MDFSFPFFIKMLKLQPLKAFATICGIIAVFFANPALSGQNSQKHDSIESILQNNPANSTPKPVSKPQTKKPTQPDPNPVVTAPNPVPVPKLSPMPEPTSPPVPSSLPTDVPPPQDSPYEKPSIVRENNMNAIDNQPSENRSFPHFGDRKPHVWTSPRKPWNYEIHGTDVSWHNKSLNWSQMARNGISFVFIKATEGGDFLDPTFAQNWKAAKQAGIARGAYHFYYFCRSAKDQLRWYIRNVPKDNSALPPVLDMEWNHASKTCKYQPSPAIVHREMRVFLRGVEKHYGKKPIIYTSVDFFDDNDLGKAFKGYPFWLRSVAAHPDESYDNHPWLFWQYTGTGRVPGMEGDADINIFVGNGRHWKNWRQNIR